MSVGSCGQLGGPRWPAEAGHVRQDHHCRDRWFCVRNFTRGQTVCEAREEKPAEV